MPCPPSPLTYRFDNLMEWAPFNFIDNYASYADVLEAPRAMHEAVGIQVVAAVLNKNGVSIEHGALTYTLDIWTALLSGSGEGRSTLVTMANPVLEQAGISKLARPSHWGSPQALYQGFEQYPSGLFIWGELSEKLRLFNDRSFSGVKEWLTDRYDNSGVPDPVTYRDTGRKSRDTPPIVFKQAPRINILGTSSDEWFFNNLAQEDSAGGFLPRWMMIRAERSGRIIPTPQAPDKELVAPLAAHLQKVNELKGAFNLAEILTDYDTWYRSTKARFDAQPNRTLATAYFNRHRVHVLKLAAVYHVASSVSLRISPRAWSQAVQTASDLERTIFSLLPTAMSKEGHAVDRMAELVKRAGAAGMPKSAFTRAFQHSDSRERSQRLQTLIDAETISEFSHKTTGRCRTILVHCDFVKQYQAANPDDTPR